LVNAIKTPINYTASNKTIKKERVSGNFAFQCDICNTTHNSQVSYDQHCNGKSHFKKVAAHDNEMESFALQCNLCNLSFNSTIAAKQHFTGKKHAMNLGESNVSSTATSTSKQIQNPTVGGSKKDSSTIKYECSICKISTTSHDQLQSHFRGVRHKLAAGTMKEIPEWWKGNNMNIALF